MRIFMRLLLWSFLPIILLAHKQRVQCMPLQSRVDKPPYDDSRWVDFGEANKFDSSQIYDFPNRKSQRKLEEVWQYKFPTVPPIETRDYSYTTYDRGSRFFVPIPIGLLMACILSCIGGKCCCYCCKSNNATECEDTTENVQDTAGYEPAHYIIVFTDEAPLLAHTDDGNYSAESEQPPTYEEVVSLPKEDSPPAYSE